MLITVAVPTYNRPQLLRVALASIAAQNHPEWEVVVVDDGSAPPVLESTLRELLGERFILVRHDQAQGIAAAKNAGVAAARGDVVLHLDDDDLLTPVALAQIAAAYARHPELECLFINVEPFGTCASGTAANRSHALSRLLERAQGVEDNGVVSFNSKLFAAVLKSVPMAMQRPAARKTLWDRVGLLRKGSYMPEPEWAMKSALVCKPALLLQYAYLARMDGQNYVSRTSQKEKHMLRRNRHPQYPARLDCQESRFCRARPRGPAQPGRCLLRPGLPSSAQRQWQRCMAATVCLLRNPSAMAQLAFCHALVATLDKTPRG